MKKKQDVVLKNNLFILKIAHEVSHFRIPLAILNAILEATSSFIFDVFLFQFIMNGIQEGKTFQSIAFGILLALLFQLVFIFFKAWYGEVFLPVENTKIQRRLQTKIFDKAVKVDLFCYEDPKFYDGYVKSISEAGTRINEVIGTLSDLVYAISWVFSVSVVFLTINPFLIIFAVLPLIANLIFGKKINYLKYDFNMEMQEKSRKRDYVKRTFYLADYAKEMRLTQINKVMLSKMRDAVNDLTLVIKEKKLPIALFDYMFVILNNVVVYLGAIIFSAFQTVVSKTMLVGDCFVVINSISSFAWGLERFYQVYMKFHDHSLYINNLRYFLECEPKIKSGERELPQDKTISFQNVSFGYTDKYVLKDINFTIRQGEKIALVGENGAGKSTLVKLLLRLYESQQGAIKMGNINIKELHLDAYRGSFGVVFQDCKVFALTVAENILFADRITDEDKKSVISSLERSGLSEKVNSYPKNINAILTKEFDQDGIVLSGGEAQKLAIARVFHNPYDIVVLDEPTSALDPIAEYNMYQNMLEACEGKTVIFISHRMSSSVLADQVFFLENGEILERGTHQELIDLNGKYKYLWNLQAEKYKKEKP